MGGERTRGEGADEGELTGHGAARVHSAEQKEGLLLGPRVVGALGEAGDEDRPRHGVWAGHFVEQLVATDEVAAPEVGVQEMIVEERGGGDGGCFDEGGMDSSAAVQ